MKAACCILRWRTPVRDTSSLTYSLTYSLTRSLKGKLVKLYEQANIYDFHKTSIDNLLYITKPFPLLITAARDDNMLHLWDLSHGHQRCRKVASIKHVDKSKVFIDNLVKSMGKAQRSNYYCSKSSSTATNSAAVAAITAVCDIPHTPHICVCSADCAVTLYEMFTNEPCGKITDLKEVPTCIVAFPQIIEDSAVSGGTHSRTHSLTYLLTHSCLLTHALTHLLTHALTHLLTHSLTHLLTYSLTHSLTRR